MESTRHFDMASLPVTPVFKSGFGPSRLPRTALPSTQTNSLVKPSKVHCYPDGEGRLEVLLLQHFLQFLNGRKMRAA